MNGRHALAVFGVSAAAALALAGAPAAARDDEKASPGGSEPSSAPEPFALVELFTSEGCNSCPPADALAAALVERGRKGDERIFVLSFHVDYWNRLGWPDPFSSAEHTRRQQAYARALGGKGVYTPQMIVNGTDAFVGSKRAQAEASVAAALKAKASARVTLEASRSGDGEHVGVRWRVAGAPAGAVLELALVERGIAVDVKRGENAGKTLPHENVVRVFKTIALTDATEGSTTLAPPEGCRLERCRVIGFVQKRDTMAIVGAERADVGS